MYNKQKVYIPAVQKEIEVSRIIGQFSGKKKKPTLVFFAGVHGNETSGLYAVRKVLKSIKKQSIPLLGNVYAICGNMNGLTKGIRFEHVDLNRVWSHTKIKTIKLKNTENLTEDNEQLVIYELVKSILAKGNGPYFFLDMHSTSAETTPFITISDSLNNRRFTKNFPVPIILGIEEYLDGTLLSFINEFGHIALGFEAGQHDDIQAIYNCEAFIWLCLVKSGCLSKKDVKDYKRSKKLLKKLSPLKGEFFEIDYRQVVTPMDDFRMQGKFLNFDFIKKGQELAIMNKKEIYAPFKGRIFMPLYQKQGDDGFFVVTKVSKYWLAISKLLRGLNFHYFLRLLPGIRQYKPDKNILIIHAKTAKAVATEIFHLFGYRRKVSKQGNWLFFKRDKKIKPFE